MRVRTFVFCTGMIFILILTCGCISSPQTPTPQTPTVPTPTPTSSPIMTTIAPTPPSTSIPTTIPPTPSSTITQDRTLEKQQIDTAWREIQLEWDILKEKERKLDNQEFTIDEINTFRQIILPETLERYQQILSNLTQIKSSDPITIAEREDLTTICNYKIHMIEGLSAYYHATQIVNSDSTTGRTVAIDEYRNAKYAFEDAIGLITPFEDTNKYYYFARRDRIELEASISTINEELEELYY